VSEAPQSRDERSTPTNGVRFTGTSDREDLRLLYEKTFAVAMTFIDWRHKVITLGISIAVATVVIEEWLAVHTSGDWKMVLTVPAAFAGRLFFALRQLDARNEAILAMAYARGTSLEIALGAESGAALEGIPASRAAAPQTYSAIVSRLFRAATWACGLWIGAVALWSVVHWLR